MVDRPGLLGRLLGRRTARPTETVGEPGVAIYAGYPETFEESRELVGARAYRTYGNILANVSIVAAGVRYYLNLVGGSTWSLSPAEGDTEGEWAERTESMLMRDPATPWHRVVRRAAMYRMYGFSIQEWTMKRHAEGYFTYADIAPRAQRTIERWDVDGSGVVQGVLQRSPQTSQDTYIPRNKIVYVVDDSLHDGPQGLGLFRHLADPAKRLERYTQLEGYGFESDLRGIPVAYGPFAALAQLVARGAITAADRTRIERPLREFMANHTRNPALGIVLDSAVYTGEGEQRTPVNVKQWQIDLLKGESHSFAENAAAIERLNRELARILGVEKLLLGATSTGSLALSEDKTRAFYQVIESVLTELRETFQKDLVERAWQTNGWSEAMMPTLSTSAVQHRTAGEVATVLRDMATAGAVLDPDDAVINDVRELAGVSLVDLEASRQRAAEEAQLRAGEMEALRGLQQPEGTGDEA